MPVCLKEAKLGGKIMLFASHDNMGCNGLASSKLGRKSLQ